MKQNNLNFLAISIRIGLLLTGSAVSLWLNNAWGGNDIQFNTDVLDASDRDNIDMSQFSRRGFIMPGEYTMTLRVNKQELPEQLIRFYPPDNDPKGSEACITAEMVEELALTTKAQKKITWWHDGECMAPDSLPGVTLRGDLSTTSLYASIPQAYLEYTSENWDPPSRWDNGIPGVILDYNLNMQNRQQQGKGESRNFSGNGTLGMNMGPWRLRADWQARVDSPSTENQRQENWSWSRYYLYRALPQLGAKLELGENYLDTDIFDAYRFSGVSLKSDDAMLPPDLRGYAPEVTGVARTNARVVISQQGRVLEETQVAAGPFRIQNINDAVTGELDVRVEEQDGTAQTFKVQTANIPYLTRPGSVRYKLAAGRPTDFRHHNAGPLLGTGEFSWGVSNGWSLYGGTVGGENYQALAAGIGRDLMILGAMSFDITESRAKTPREEDSLTGRSYRLSYSKKFDRYDSQITFAGYRFSERNYLGVSEFLDMWHRGERAYSSKEMYTISLNKQFSSLNLGSYFNYSHQTYWDQPESNRYDLSLSRYVDIGRFKNISLSLAAYRYKYSGVKDDGMYLSLSIPFADNASISYSGTLSRGENSHRVSYYDRINESNSYQLSSGINDRRKYSASASYDHKGEYAEVNTNASYQQGSYSAISLGIRGGVVATLNGAALHSNGNPGSTRVLLDTDSVAGIPMHGPGINTRSNYFGKAVVADLGSYYRNRISIDLTKLPDNAEAQTSVVQATLTEGAIGYRRFNVIAGEKALAVIRLADGSAPPFGASVLNKEKQEVGIVNDDGSAYLSGINPGDEMMVSWSDRQCVIALPATISESSLGRLILPCRLKGEKDNKPAA
ncbi:outer membrane usher protein [Enterobacteriaceae bacterium H18W14]|uniref:outer membrane usher protein n=1 Tax=Dryocola boscaweniae TaxID=2925397 RepID=UPI0022EFD9A3|nr:outer membrane usher protein [Dryocola boscaweniae]MCT4715253.1 outer membrane usher protein [Dryocola boscaweniae]